MPAVLSAQSGELNKASLRYSASQTAEGVGREVNFWLASTELVANANNLDSQYLEKTICALAADSGVKFCCA